MAADSTNWGGYVVQGSGLRTSCVEAAWVEPSVTCPRRGTTAVAIWVGIDGAASGGSASPLMQTGTTAICADGTAHHSAWHEVYPSQPTLSWPMAVRPGDRMWAQVSYSGAKFHLTIANLTTGAANRIDERVRNARRLMAEWIVEAPAINCPDTCSRAPLARFTPVTFTAARVTMGGRQGGIVGPWDRVAIRLMSGTHVAATTGPVAANGRSFTVTWRQR